MARIKIFRLFLLISMPLLSAFAQDFGLAEYLEESTIGNEDIASTYTDNPEVEYEQSNIEMAESSLLNILKDKEEAIIDDARQKEHLIDISSKTNSSTAHLTKEFFGDKSSVEASDKIGKESIDQSEEVPITTESAALIQDVSSIFGSVLSSEVTNYEDISVINSFEDLTTIFDSTQASIEAKQETSPMNEVTATSLYSTIYENLTPSETNNEKVLENVDQDEFDKILNKHRENTSEKYYETTTNSQASEESNETTFGPTVQSIETKIYDEEMQKIKEEKSLDVLSTIGEEITERQYEIEDKNIETTTEKKVTEHTTEGNIDDEQTILTTTSGTLNEIIDAEEPNNTSIDGNVVIDITTTDNDITTERLYNTEENTTDNNSITTEQEIVTAVVTTEEINTQNISFEDANVDENNMTTLNVLEETSPANVVTETTTIIKTVDITSTEENLTPTEQIFEATTEVLDTNPVEVITHKNEETVTATTDFENPTPIYIEFLSNGNMDNISIQQGVIEETGITTESVYETTSNEKIGEETSEDSNNNNLMGMTEENDNVTTEDITTQNIEETPNSESSTDNLVSTTFAEVFTETTAMNEADPIENISENTINESYEGSTEDLTTHNDEVTTKSDDVVTTEYTTMESTAKSKTDEEFDINNVSIDTDNTTTENINELVDESTKNSDEDSLLVGSTTNRNANELTVELSFDDGNSRTESVDKELESELEMTSQIVTTPNSEKIYTTTDDVVDITTEVFASEKTSEEILKTITERSNVTTIAEVTTTKNIVDKSNESGETMEESTENEIITDNDDIQLSFTTVPIIQSFNINDEITTDASVDDVTSTESTRTIFDIDELTVGENAILKNSEITNEENVQVDEIQSVEENEIIPEHTKGSRQGRLNNIDLDEDENHFDVVTENQATVTNDKAEDEASTKNEKIMIGLMTTMKSFTVDVTDTQDTTTSVFLKTHTPTIEYIETTTKSMREDANAKIVDEIQKLNKEEIVKLSEHGDTQTTLDKEFLEDGDNDEYNDLLQENVELEDSKEDQFVTGKVLNQDGKMCLMANVTLKVKINGTTVHIPPNATLVGRCLDDKKLIQVTWRSSNESLTNNSVTLSVKFDGSSNFISGVHVNISDVNHKGSVSVEKNGLTLTESDVQNTNRADEIDLDEGVALQISKMFVVIPEENVVTEANIVNINQQADAIGLISIIVAGVGGLSIVIVVISVLIYRKLRKNVFKMTSVE